MISVIGYALEKLDSNPLVNETYMGNDLTSSTNIGDLCEGIYDTSGGQSYKGKVMNVVKGISFNLNVIHRKFDWIAYLVHACLLPCKLSLITINKYFKNVTKLHFHTIPVPDGILK